MASERKRSKRKIRERNKKQKMRVARQRECAARNKPPTKEQCNTFILDQQTANQELIDHATSIVSEVGGRVISLHGTEAFGEFEKILDGILEFVDEFKGRVVNIDREAEVFINDTTITDEDAGVTSFDIIESYTSTRDEYIGRLLTATASLEDRLSNAKKEVN